MLPDVLLPLVCLAVLSHEARMLLQLLKLRFSLE